MSIRWTPSQDADLRRLRHRGLTWAEIAAGMEVSAVAARNRVYRLGIREKTPPPSTTWTPERDAMLQQLIGQGLSRSQIAARMGVSKTTVTHRWSRLTRNRPEPTPPEPNPIAHQAPGYLCAWVRSDPSGMPRSKCKNPRAPARLYCWGHCAKAFERGLKAA